jgi:hypothetical protein
MGERVDHIDRAQQLQKAADSIINGVEMAPHMLAVIQLDKARLHAQLALGAEQRTANLIAFLGTRAPNARTQGYLVSLIEQELGL